MPNLRSNRLSFVSLFNTTITVAILCCHVNLNVNERNVIPARNLMVSGAATVITPDVDDLFSITTDFPYVGIREATWTITSQFRNTFLNVSDGSRVRPILLRNPGGDGWRFACGFVCNGTCRGFLFSVFSISVNEVRIPSPNVQIVWTANRGKPVRKNATVSLKRDGDLQLTDADGTLVWSTNTSGKGVVSIQLHKSGNLVLADAANSTVWRSWDHPTDTLLKGQPFAKGQRLVASISTSNSSEGPYSFAFDDIGFFLYVAAPGNPEPYYPVVTFSNSDAVALFISNNTQMEFDGFLSSGDYVFVLNFTNDPVASYFLRLDPDGVLRVYRDFIENWETVYNIPAINTPCMSPTYCGLYGLCTDGQCSCFYGNGSFNPLDLESMNLGCTPSTPLQVCPSVASIIHDFVQLDNVDYFTVLPGNPPNYISTDSLEKCKQICFQNCYCKAAFFVTGLSTDQSGGFCYITTEVYTMRNITSATQFLPSAHYKSIALIKIQKPEPTHLQVKNGSSSRPRVVIGVATGMGVLISVSVVISIFRIYVNKIAQDSESDEDAFLSVVPGLPTRFTFQELQKATENFNKKLGAGGFGSVFLGTLPDGTQIAVKRLEGSSRGNREFKNEVCTIGSIHHFNLVRLCGFCAEKGHRLLVYDFMPNGSLDRWLFTKSHISPPNGVNETGLVLDWSTRFSIALGTAQGLAYLHEQCRERIIHFDVKPQNILLDANFVAKVSDFGLSKFVDRDESHVITAMRGTPGYLAPEWLHSRVTEKADVYSFGIVLLEIVSGRRSYDLSNPDSEMGGNYFPTLAKLKVQQGNEIELIDDRLNGVFGVKEAKRAVHVALWCIHGDPSSRPSMGNVVQMLEGNIPVEKPTEILSSTDPESIWIPHTRKVVAPINESSTIPMASVLSMTR